jgi:hypothetical protein
MGMIKVVFKIQELKEKLNILDEAKTKVEANHIKLRPQKVSIESKLLWFRLRRTS